MSNTIRHDALWFKDQAPADVQTCARVPMEHSYIVLILSLNIQQWKFGLVWFGVTMTLALIVAVMESLLCRTCVGAFRKQPPELPCYKTPVCCGRSGVVFYLQYSSSALQCTARLADNLSMNILASNVYDTEAHKVTYIFIILVVVLFWIEK